jgi:hypothetical protein
MDDSLVDAPAPEAALSAEALSEFERKERKKGVVSLAVVQRCAAWSGAGRRPGFPPRSVMLTPRDDAAPRRAFAVSAQ